MTEKHNTPLDLAGQITWIAWNLRELPDHAPAIDPVIDRSLALGGIKEFTNLRYRKAQSLSVFGQVSHFPKGNADKTAELLHSIDQYLTNQLPIVVPKGDAVPAGVQPTETINAANWKLSDVYYRSPYTGKSPIEVDALAIGGNAVLEIGQGVLLDL